jgi:Lysyl oxidase
MLRKGWVRGLIVLSLAGAALSVPLSSTAAGAGPASLRLISVLHRVVATRSEGDNQLYLSPGVYLAATGGTFEIDAVRGTGGRIALWQVARDEQGTHQIRAITAPATVHYGSGLPAFFVLTMRDAAGRVVEGRTMPYCLDGGSTARVDATGPDHSSYPFDCGGPLTKGDAWGIDEGWASAIDASFPFTAPDGTYSLTIAIARSYASQLDIPDADSAVAIQVVVSTQAGGQCGDIRCPLAVTRRTAQVRTSQLQTEGPTTTATGTTSGGTNGLEQGDGLPDLRALPAHGLHITHLRHNDHDYLDFGATIWNAGSGPLVLEGFRDGAAETMPATQFIYRDGRPVSSKTIGQFEFDKRRGHDHWHMADIAQYDLLDKDGNRLLLSGKQSFCLAPTDAIDLTLPGAAWEPDQAGLWSACDGEAAIWLREVLPAGWGDTYYQNVAGQSFDITGLANGQYQIRVTVDPLQHLEETSYANNAGLRTITLGGTPGHRTVKLG